MRGGVALLCGSEVTRLVKFPATEYGGYVDHPRFGRKPRFTGLNAEPTPDGKVFCHWHSPVGTRVPNTAIAADTARQGRVTVHVTHYFDSRRVCRKCGRPFLFFAEEQKFWYEELQFPLESDCLECVLCRKEAQHLQVTRERYEELFANAARTEAETLELVECGVLLAESSVFSTKLLPRLRGHLKPLLDGPHSARARALVARMDLCSPA
jgi:hypothetical protein